MAERKFLHMATDGYSEESATSDSTTLGGLTMGGNIDMQSSGKVISLTDGSAAGDALAYGQAGNLASLVIASAGDITVSGGGELTGLPATPSGDTAAASKAYVDAVAEGLDPKESVVVATTAAGTLATDFENGDTVDGVVLATNDRILIKDQASGIENGIYIVQASGAPSRASDLASGASAAGVYCWAEEGTANADQAFICTNNSGSDVVGTDALTFTQFSGAGQITAGAGLTKSGNTIDIGNGDGITINADSIELDLAASNPGLQLTGTSPNKEVSVLPKTAEGIDVDASGVKVVLEADAAIVFDGTNGGLEINLEASNPTLDIASNELGVKFSTTASGLDQDANGLKAKVDGTTITINGSGQLVASGAGEATKVAGDYTAAEDVASADPVYWETTTANRFGKADADGAGKQWVFGVATAAITTGNSGEIVSNGPADVLSGASNGVKYYLQSGGGIGTSVPGAGKHIVYVGHSMDSDTLFVQLQYLGKKAA